jgi:hypothetical protein
MHWKTYHKLAERCLALEDGALACAAVKLKGRAHG